MSETHEERRANAPRLAAHDSYGGMVAVWCDFCGEHHRHQRPFGHKEAHCRSPKSPYYDSGYTIVVASPGTPKGRR